jgi:DNA adenine methylase
MSLQQEEQLSKPTYNPSAHSFSGWVGGKSQLAKTIINMMPAHKTYCEVFGGAGWVLFKKSPSAVEIINDVNSELVNLYRIYKYHFTALLDEYSTQLISRDDFYRFRDTPAAGLTDVQRAARFYYILRNCYGARITNPSFTSHPLRPAGLKLGEELKQHLQSVHERLQRVTVENQSYDQIIGRFDTPGSLFYLDPPYYEFEKYYGKDIFGRGDFEKLATILRGIKGKFILSLNDVPPVREIFSGFHFYEKKIRWSLGTTHGTNDDLGNELIITNFEVPAL